jgi:integrase
LFQFLSERFTKFRLSVTYVLPKREPMAKATFTARWVEGVKPPATGQIDYFDAKPPGVGLRVSNKGRKTWFVMYRSGGRLRRLTLGTYPALTLADARDQATAAKHTVAKGEDPALQKQSARTAPTVADLATQYLDRYAKHHKKSWRDDARLLNREVLPEWGRRKAHDITRRDVLALLDGIVERGSPIQANRILALIRVMFNWTISRDVLEHNPCYQVKAPSKESQRDRVLTEEEIRLVWGACAQLDAVLAAYFQIRLLTAQRGGEIRLMHWEDVDLDTGWWTIPAHIAKNGLAHRVPLSNPAQSILRALRSITGSTTWVFPSPRRLEKPIVNVRKPALRVRALSKVDFIPHDLRRTAASHMTGMGIPRLVVSKILNHAEMGVTKVYDRHSYDAEKREALEVWGQKVMALMNGMTGKVMGSRH